MSLPKVNLHYFQKRHARALSLYIHKEKLSRNYIEKQKSTLSYIRTSNFRLWLAALFFFFVYVNTSQKISSITQWSSHCEKSVQIRSYFWSVFSCIQSKYREIRTRNNSVFGHYSGNAQYWFTWLLEKLLLNKTNNFFELLINTNNK